MVFIELDSLQIEMKENGDAGHLSNEENGKISPVSNIAFGALGHHGLRAQQIMQGHQADDLAIRAI